MYLVRTEGSTRATLYDAFSQCELQLLLKEGWEVHPWTEK